MRKDLLRELHLPKIDVKCLQEIVTQNSTRLAHLLKENEFMNKNDLVPSGYKEISASMVSDFSGADPAAEKVKPVNGQTVSQVFQRGNKDMGVDSNRDIDQFLENSSPATVAVGAGCVTLASDLGWGSENEDEDENEVVEIRPGPMRFSLKTETPLPWELDLTADKSDEPESSMCDGTEFLCHSNTDDSCEEKTEPPTVPEKEKEIPDDTLPIDPSCKPLRCYSRKRTKQENPKPDKVNESSRGESKEAPPADALCVISEVVGNADAAFSAPDNPADTSKAAQDAQLITPKKTNDITKIKGWRRKQFFVEKSTTIEFYSYANGFSKQKKIELSDLEKLDQPEEPGNVENAFVCDSLDEFLDREAELKINYEIPHLYAEVGIKLTSDEIVSKPNLSEEDFKSVETRYCVPIKLEDAENSIDWTEECGKGVKRCIEDSREPCKALKLEENKRKSVRTSKQGDKPRIKQEPVSILRNPPVKSEKPPRGDSVTLTSKLLGLVVYPGPHRALHPLVRNHLQKLRSYRTGIDANWANFAASAVVTKEKNCKRSIVPVYCCGKIEKNSKVPTGSEVDEVVRDLVDSVCTEEKANGEDTGEAEKQSSQQVSLLKKNADREFALKECSVVINKINSEEASGLWCMDHNCYNCSPCGLASDPPGRKKRRMSKPGEIPASVSPQASFDNAIAGLLARKLRALRLNGDTLTSIDCLKNLTPNTVEFVRLNFIKQSFLTGYISIWYLRPEGSCARSRAFLTFSKTPPVSNAINLKSSVFSLQNLPKVITEIVSVENAFDSNEYAILHCNGEIWEIHGSLNIAVGKSEQRDVDQIFTPVEIPELKKLQRIAMEILKKKAAKWWVVDLTQEFKEIELGSGASTIVLTRKKFLSAIKSESFGFQSVRKDTKGRVFGAYVIERLLPFVLIGPYYFLESHDMVVRNNFSAVPFMYYGEENVSRDYPLKFFINSVLKELQDGNKKLEGLWLYDKVSLDKTCYLEVMTTNSDRTLPKQLYSINVEHGYSLKSLTCTSPAGSPSGIIKSRKDGKEALKKVAVYLYFDIFELGYVEGTLHLDNSVIINHPLDGRTKVKSHKIGDWFIGIIRRKIQFIPGDLAVKWFVTKHMEDLRDRSPFNAFYLGGAYILCRSGLYDLLQMTDSKIRELGLDKEKLLGAMGGSQVVNEVKELKALAEVVSPERRDTLTTEEILQMAVEAIQNEEKLTRDLLSYKNKRKKVNTKLISSFLWRLNSLPIDFHRKIKWLGHFVRTLVREFGGLNEEFMRRIMFYRFGRSYLKRLKSKEKGFFRFFPQRQLKSTEQDPLACDESRNSNPRADDPPETTRPNGCSILRRGGNKSDRNILLTKLNPPQVSINAKEATQLRQGFKTLAVGSNAEAADSKVLQNGFIKLTSPELPKNIRVQTCGEVELTARTQERSVLKNNGQEKQGGKASPASPTKKILIIKNIKNNRTARHRLNGSELPKKRPPSQGLEENRRPRTEGETNEVEIVEEIAPQGR